LKLLLDQNLSYRLIDRLADTSFEIEHVRNLGLAEAYDSEIWESASKNNYTIVSKDSDFHQKIFLHGHPPKVIWLLLGNCTTSAIENLLRQDKAEIKAFLQDKETGLLTLP